MQHITAEGIQAVKRVLIIGSISVLILYLLPLILVFLFQRRFMYFPPADYYPPADVNLSAAEEIYHESAGGNIFRGWWLQPSKQDLPIIMFFHGNGSAVYSNHVIYRDLQEQGFGVYGVGYAGYPGSTGAPSQTGIIEGARLQYDWLLEQGVPPEKIVFYGTSLGSGISAALSLERRPAKLILEAPFNSALDMAQISMPVFPVGLLMKDTYRSDEALKHLDVPLSWLHGSLDEVVPLSQGRKLYEAYEGPKTHLIIPGGYHTDLWNRGGREFVLAELQR